MYATLGSPLTSILALPKLKTACTHTRARTQREGEREAKRQTYIETVTHAHKLTHGCCVVCGAKDELWQPVVATADVRHVGLPLDQHLGACKVAPSMHTRAPAHREKEREGDKETDRVRPRDRHRDIYIDTHTYLWMLCSQSRQR